MERNYNKQFTRLRADKTSSGATRAAQFLLLLEKEDAAAILRQLSEEEIEKISAEMAKVEKISKEDAKSLLKTFETQSLDKTGGKEAARKILHSAFGEEKAKEILKKALPVENVFSFLNPVRNDTLLQLIEKETTQIIALILAQLPTKKAADILQKLAPMQQAGVAAKLANTKEVTQEILHQVASSLKRKLHTHDFSTTLEIDGVSHISEILRHTDLATREAIIHSLQDQDATLGEKIEASLFTSDLILLIEDKALQSVLREVDNTLLCYFIRGKEAAISQKILSNVSERRRMLIMEEYRMMHAVPRKKAEEASKNFLAFLKKCESEGKIIIGDEVIS